MPFPFLAAIPAIASGIGQIFGNAGKGSADQRMGQNQQNLQRSQLLSQLYNTQQGAQSRALESQSDEALRQAQLALQQRQFGLQAPQVRGQQAIRGSLMQNLQPASFSGLPSGIQSKIPQMTGGLSPAAFSPQVRQMGAQLQRDALLGQLKGDQFDPMTPTDFQGGLLTPPKIAELEKSGLLENILGAGGLIGSLIGAIGDPARQSGTYKEGGLGYPGG